MSDLLSQLSFMARSTIPSLALWAILEANALEMEPYKAAVTDYRVLCFCVI